MLKVEGNENLVRDGNSAVLNTSESEYQAFMAIHTQKTRDSQRIQKLEETVSLLDNKLEMILELLRK